MLKFEESGYPVYYEREGYRKEPETLTSFNYNYYSTEGTIEISKTMIIGRIILKETENGIEEVGKENEDIKLEDGYLLFDYSSSGFELKKVIINTSNPYVNYLSVQHLDINSRNKLIDNNYDQMREYAKRIMHYYDVAKDLDEKYSESQKKMIEYILNEKSKTYKKTK